jgi:hypothetical protein
MSSRDTRVNNRLESKPSGNLISRRVAFVAAANFPSHRETHRLKDSIEDRYHFLRA